MPLTEQQIKALKTDAIVNLSKTELSDKDISIIIKVLTGGEKIAKLTLPGNQLYKDYQLLINAILQHSTLLEVDFANQAVLANSEPLSQNTPTAMYERILLVCLAYKNEIYHRVVKAKEKSEKLRTELSKDMLPSVIVATLALTVKNIHKEIEKIQRFEYFMKFFSDKFNTETSKFSYNFSLPEQNNLFNQIKNFSEDNIKDRNSLKKVFLDKFKKHSSEVIELNLSGWDFVDKDFSDLVKIFFSSISSSKKLRRFTLTYSIFSQAAADFVFSMIGKYPLESVDISNNSNFDPYQEKFFSIIAHSKSVITLDVRNTLSMPATKILLKMLIKFNSSVRVVKLTKDKKDNEQKILLEQLRRNSKKEISSVQHDFSESIKYFSGVMESLKDSHKGQTLTNLESKFVRFKRQPNLEDEKRLYIGIMEFLMELDKPIRLLAFHFTALNQYCLHKVNDESKLDDKDERLDYLALARMYIDRIFSKYNVTENFCEEIKPLAFEVCKKYLLLYIEQNVKTCGLSEEDISFVKVRIKGVQSMPDLQENLNTLLLMADQHAKLKQNVIFEKIALVYSNTCCFEKKTVSATENKTNIAYTLKGSIWGKVGKLSNAVQIFLSSVTEKDKIPDDKSPAP